MTSWHDSDWNLILKIALTVALVAAVPGPPFIMIALIAWRIWGK